MTISAFSTLRTQYSEMTRTRESMTLSPNDSNSDSDDLRNPVATGEAVTPLELCDWRCVAWRVTDGEISTSRPVLLEGIGPLWYHRHHHRRYLSPNSENKQLPLFPVRNNRIVDVSKQLETGNTSYLPTTDAKCPNEPRMRAEPSRTAPWNPIYNPSTNVYLVQQYFIQRCSSAAAIMHTTPVCLST